MKITVKDTHTANGSDYNAVTIETGKTVYTVLKVSGKLNYVSVRKHVPGSTLGKEFGSFAEAQSNYKSATVKTVLLMAEESLTGSFRVHIENMDSGKKLKGGIFTTKGAADKFKRSLKKQFALINHGGYIVNYNERLELFTNY